VQSGGSQQKVPDLNCDVQDLPLEVVDLKQMCRIWDPVGSPKLTPGYKKLKSLPNNVLSYKNKKKNSLSIHWAAFATQRG